MSTNLTESFQLIGTNTNVTSGSQTCMPWPSLDPNSEYEWYVEVSDGVNTTTGPVWTFTTPPPSTISISGNVWNDVNGNSDGFVNNSAAAQLPPGEGIPIGIKAYLVNASTGLVEKEVFVSPTGTFSFSEVATNNIYRVVISTIQVFEGDPQPTSIIPIGWQHTGQIIGTGPGTDGLNDGILVVEAESTNIIDVNFGIRRKFGDVSVG